MFSYSKHCNKVSWDYFSGVNNVLVACSCTVKYFEQKPVKYVIFDQFFLHTNVTAIRLQRRKETRAFFKNI
jgi:hypothetical protein